VLNGRVRDGNGCGHSGLVTGSTVLAPASVYDAPFAGAYILCQSGGQVLHLAARLGTSGGVDGAAKRSAVSTGWLSASPHVHARPIDPVVSREPSLFAGYLISGEVSRLYAFSVYPVHTWLPSGTASAITGTPEVCPSQSSRTREKAPQVSSARSR
jgi:hypothetical protein